MKISIKNMTMALLLMVGAVMVSCTGDNTTNDPKVIGSKPEPVTDYSVESTYGGAFINFKMPVSSDLLYVKAVYEIADGVQQEAKASLYKNQLELKGFPAEGDYEVTLYAVAKGEVMSDPTVITVHSLMPPFLRAFESMVLQTTYGGVNVQFSNETKADLAVYLLEKDSLGEWFHKYTFFSDVDVNDYSVRGYDSEPFEFGVYVKDRWDNTSDTLTRTIVPLYETLLNKKLFKNMKLPTDTWEPHPSYTFWTLERIWDDNYSENYMYHSAPFLFVWPVWFTIDLGNEYKFSRFNMRNRATYTAAFYGLNSVRKFELYGSNDPNRDGSWDESWEFINNYEVIKPSGEPMGTLTNEDKEQYNKGFEFTFGVLTPSYRYLRVKIIESWDGLPGFNINELTFWGEYVSGPNPPAVEEE